MPVSQSIRVPYPPTTNLTVSLEARCCLAPSCPAAAQTQAWRARPRGPAAGAGAGVGAHGLGYGGCRQRRVWCCGSGCWPRTGGDWCAGVGGVGAEWTGCGGWMNLQTEKGGEREREGAGGGGEERDERIQREGLGLLT